MRVLTTTTILLGLAVMTAGPASADGPVRISACPSRDKAEQIIQSNGNLKPEGCRIFTITRVDSSAGAMCALQFADHDSGIIGQITSTFETTQWWAPCNELHGP